VATRRKFLEGTLAAGAAFSIVPRHVLGGPGHTPPSEKRLRATVGAGGMGGGGARGSDVVCDVDRHHLERFKDGRRKLFGDFREALAVDGLDQVYIATPPHWHGLVAIAAAKVGLDVRCEKPMTHTIAEGRALVKAIRDYGRVCFVNVHGRLAHGGRLRKLAQSGLLGRPLTVCRRGGFKARQWSGRTDLTPEPVPPQLDYDMWLGPAPYKPYARHRTHQTFRGYWDYDAGGLGDMGQHYLDPIQFLLDKDDTSPVTIEPYAPWPQHPDAAGLWGSVVMTYADGTRIIIESGEWGEPRYADMPFLSGPNGKVWDEAGHKTDPPDLMQKLRDFPDPPRLKGWDEARQTRDDTNGDKPNVEAAHRSCCLVNLAAIAIRLGRPLRYDPEREVFEGDEVANRMVNPPMRGPWEI
jgi:predicted dehydrogenase